MISQLFSSMAVMINMLPNGRKEQVLAITALERRFSTTADHVIAAMKAE